MATTYTEIISINTSPVMSGSDEWGNNLPKSWKHNDFVTFFLKSTNPSTSLHKIFILDSAGVL